MRWISLQGFCQIEISSEGCVCVGGGSFRTMYIPFRKKNSQKGGGLVEGVFSNHGGGNTS
jgi:hypothetical protein